MLRAGSPRAKCSRRCLNLGFKMASCPKWQNGQGEGDFDAAALGAGGSHKQISGTCGHAVRPEGNEAEGGPFGGFLSR